MPNDQTLINGGEEIEVTLLTGEKQKIKVLLLKIAQFEDYLRVVDNEPRAAELLCAQPEGWGDELAFDSIMDVIEKGHDLNFTNVFRWADRRAKLNETMLPLARKGQNMARALQNSAPMPPL